MRITKYRTEIGKDKLTVLVKESACNYASETKYLNNPESIVQMLNNCFHLNKQAEEYLYMIAFNTKAHPLGVFEVSHGTVNFSVVNPREILIRALLCGASCIVLAHNHPSGDIEPSKEDIAATKRIKESCDLIRISLLDHIIIADDCYLSILEQGNL